jgi:hypothetical protein
MGSSHNSGNRIFEDSHRTMRIIGITAWGAILGKGVEQGDDALAMIGFIYLARDVSHRWLFVIFALQFFEAWRWCASWVIGKP